MFKKAVVIIIGVLLTMSLAACSVDINGDRIELNGNVQVTTGTTLEKSQDLSESAQGLKTLAVKNNAGNVSISRADVTEISVNVVKKVRGTDEKAKKDIMDNIDIKLEKSGDKLTVKAGTKDGSDLWNWVEKVYHGLNVTIDYDIKVPESIKFYDIGTNAGNTGLHSLKGEILVDMQAGNLDMDNASFEGNSRMNVTAGNITLDAADISGASGLEIRGTAGNATLTFPAKSAFSLEAGVTAGVLSGSLLTGITINRGNIEKDINGGGTKVKVTMTAGNVTINGK